MHMMTSPICTERKLNVAIITTFGKDFFHILFFLIIIGRLELVKFPQFILKRYLFAHNFLIGRVIYQSVYHSFVLSHIITS